MTKQRLDDVFFVEAEIDAFGLNSRYSEKKIQEQQAARARAQEVFSCKIAMAQDKKTYPLKARIAHARKAQALAFAELDPFGDRIFGDEEFDQATALYNELSQQLALLKERYGLQ